MPARCVADVARGVVCAQCGREHRYALTGWRIAEIFLVVALAAGATAWYLLYWPTEQWKYENDDWGRGSLNPDWAADEEPWEPSW
jgi:hypothetical protein